MLYFNQGGRGLKEVMLRKIGSTREPLSEAALEIVAARFRALGDPTRLKLVQFLFEGEKSVQELCSRTGMSQANISKHLSILGGKGCLPITALPIKAYTSCARWCATRSVRDLPGRNRSFDRAGR